MLRFGVLLSQHRPLNELLEWAERFDQAGVDSLWAADHLLKPANTDALWFDCWSVLTAIAMRTRRCRVGPLVSNFVVQSPLRMALLATTLDTISNGRLDLGIGLGGAPVCSAASSVFEPFPALADRFETGIESLLRILSHEPMDLPPVPLPKGRQSPAAARLTTPCVQVPRPPIVVGGQGPRVLEVAARVADRLNVYHPPGLRGAPDLDDALRRTIDRIEARCAAHGRSVHLGRSILFDFAPGLEPRDRHELGDLVRRMAGVGFDECVAVGWPLAAGPTRSIEDLYAFVTEDLPALRGG
jgi:alkanesulfonate monooxygenase SsuD/methylene tetrahydromethanopterin reductase-like flavin-dependent oxidoreductase (luciferase family)